MALLEVKNLQTYYETRAGDNQAVDGVSFTLEGGEMLGLIGESGCGKSTAGLSIMNMTQYPGKIVGGEVWLDGKNLLTLTGDAFRNTLWAEIAMIPQSAMNALNPAYTIGKQIMEAVRLHNPGMTESQCRTHVESLLNMVGLDAKWFNAFPHKLSGGMKQRVVIAMALSCDPKVLISDEATTGLDVLIEAQILALLRKIKRERNIGIILVSHDLHMVMSICDRVGIMYAGHLVEIGTTEEIRNDPQHPYTKALFESQIDVKDFSKTVHSIEGHVPKLIHPENRCRFYSRCSVRTARCEGVPPSMRNIGGAHSVACYVGGESE